MIGAYGIFHDNTRVELRPIRMLSQDLRDWRLRLRWKRLTRRWIRRFA
jgi:hypothetical protein